jgi:hypothetical protein
MRIKSRLEAMALDARCISDSRETLFKSKSNFSGEFYNNVNDIMAKLIMKRILTKDIPASSDVFTPYAIRLARDVDLYD